MKLDEAYKLFNLDPNKSYTNNMIIASAIYTNAICERELTANPEEYTECQDRLEAAKLVYEDALKQMIRRELRRHDDNKLDEKYHGNRVG